MTGRAAAVVHVDHGKLVPVNFDKRSGGSAVQLHWQVAEKEGAYRLTVHLTPKSGKPLCIRLNVPPGDQPGPVEPLILIENVGTTKDDENDFLFHYYALFGFVPDNARPPRTLGVVVGGAGVGCSNSSYP